jgi:hypothetical protein
VRNHQVNQIPPSVWRKMERVEKQGLVKVTWEEGVLCNTGYMQFVENPLRRGVKRVKVVNEEEVSTTIELTQVMEAIGKIHYEKEHVKKEEQFVKSVKYLTHRSNYLCFPGSVLYVFTKYTKRTISISFGC